MDKLSTLSDISWGPIVVNGDAIISVSVMESVDVTALITSCEVVLIGATKGGDGIGVDVVGEGKGGKPITLVIRGVAGAEGTPVKVPPTAGTDDTGGSCRGKV